MCVCSPNARAVHPIFAQGGAAAPARVRRTGVPLTPPSSLSGGSSEEQDENEGQEGRSGDPLTRLSGERRKRVGVPAIGPPPAPAPAKRQRQQPARQQQRRDDGAVVITDDEDKRGDEHPEQLPAKSSRWALRSAPRRQLG